MPTPEGVQAAGAVTDADGEEYVPSRLVSTFMELARIPSPSRSEGDVASFLHQELHALGVSFEQDTAAESIPAGCNNTVVRLPATTDGTAIFLCSHLDTVALDDDVVPVIRDGSVTNEREAILGADNKAAVAVMLELVRELVESGEPHAGVEVVFTPCEEIGLLGAKAVDASKLAARYGYVFDHANDIGKIVCAAPSQKTVRATFVGRASHSGIAPEQGRSAIAAAARAIDSLSLGRIDDQSTANVGMIEGGTGINVVPERCTIQGEVRSLDHDKATAMASEMVDKLTDAAAAFGTDVEIDMVDEYRAYSFTDRSPAVRLAAGALKDAGYEPQLVPCGGGSDANVFNALGKPCVNLCNGMRQIHTADEHIAVEDLEGMLRVSRNLVARARVGSAVL